MKILIPSQALGCNAFSPAPKDTFAKPAEI